MISRTVQPSRSGVCAPTNGAATSSELLALMGYNPRRYPFLLQSVAHGPEAARFDILFAFPGESLTLNADAALTGPAGDSKTFLAALDSWWQRERQPNIAGESAQSLPFTGGWFLYLGYELAAEIEPGLVLPQLAGQPVAFATRVPVAIVRDCQSGVLEVVAEAAHAGCIDMVQADFDASTSIVAGQPERAWQVPVVHEEEAEEFLQIVQRVQEYIRAGDVFQANLSRRWQARFPEPPDAIALYRRLCASNPAPFAGLVLHPDFVLLSSSPERLVRRRGKRLDTRPIAGTVPRTAMAANNQEVAAALLANPKERAEHVMLIDLERNDLGRVCKGGTVAVSEFMVIESFAHVHHIVSNVTGEARDGVSPGDLLRAVFPGGTITGCPKVRCMQLIAELEGRARGAYTGSIGYLNHNGDCDLNILIRSMTLQDKTLTFAAGSGIVADSDPWRELTETRAKAKGLLLALQPADEIRS